MPTVIPSDILRLTDSHGKPIENFTFIDEKNPLVLISPEIGKTYVCTVKLLNDSEYRIHHIRFHHDYSDVKIFPEYIDVLKPKKSIMLKILWSPFTTQSIEQKCKNGKITLNFSPSCTVEIISEVKQ
jgi:hypothetical protein